MTSVAEQLSDLVRDTRRLFARDPELWEGDYTIEDIQVLWDPDPSYAGHEREDPDLRVLVDFRASSGASGTIPVDPGQALTILFRKMLVWGS